MGFSSQICLRNYGEQGTGLLPMPPRGPAMIAANCRIRSPVCHFGSCGKLSKCALPGGKEKIPGTVAPDHSPGKTHLILPASDICFSDA